MHPLRFFAAGLTIGLLAAFAPACISNPPCGPSNCLGCCNAAGACVLGNLQTECGANGLACNSCLPTQACTAGVCINAGGGDGGGTGDGGFSDGGSMDGGGADGGSTDAGQGAIALDDLCQSYLNAVCQYYVRCGYAHAQASCERELASQFSYAGSDCTALAREGIDAGRVQYDGAQARTCVDAVANLACSGTSMSQASSTCMPVFRGLVATNGTCYGYYDCSTNDACSALGVSNCPGTCLTRKGAGQPVNYSAGEQCQTDLYGYSMPDGGTECQTKVAVSGSCAPIGASSSDQTCVDTAYCDPSSKICVALKSAGGACVDGSECQSGLSCVNGVCALPGAFGSACGTNNTATCQSDLTCVGAGSANASCADKSGVSGSCFQDTDCEAGLYCKGESTNPPASGTCATKLTAGNTCTSTTECTIDNYCDNLTLVCVPKRTAGQSCTQSDACGGYTYCNGSTCQSFVCQ